MDRIEGKLFRQGLYGAYKRLEDNKDLVNSLNVFPVPDGDTGTNMFLTMKSVINKAQDAEDTIPALSKALGTGSLMGARGNSGVILSQLCRGVSTVLKDKTVVTIDDVVEASESAKDTAYKAVLKPTEGTILTVSRMMAEFAAENHQNYKRIDKFLEAIIVEGHRALNMTPEMLPVLKEAGVVDAGGKGLLTLMEGFLAGITGEEVDFGDINQLVEPTAHQNVSHAEMASSDIKYGYCTEFLIKTEHAEDFANFRKEIEVYGDSIVVVGAEDMIKTHIHTNNPGRVLEKALERGYLVDIKIDNMRVQHSHRIATDAQVEAAQRTEAKPNKKYGFVAISMGGGFDEVFHDFGVDEIISGGQTMNPSTEDIVEAAERVRADNVIIMPNNKNIILAAKQAVDLVEDKKIIVIETKSVPQAFTVLINFDETLDIEENMEAMNEALEEVTTLELTYAVRDTKVGDIEIKKDDVIGIKEKDIIVKGKDPQDTMYELVTKSLDDSSSLVTLYYGEDVAEEDAQDLVDRLEEDYDDLDFELIFGGQPLYYYVASIE